MVTDLEADPRLPPEIVRFIRAAVEDRSLEEVTRNNMANCLLIQADHDPELAALFMRMVDDMRESPTWREYASQYLAGTVAFAPDRAAITAKMWQLAEHGDGPITGTALIQLDLIEQQGATKLEERYSALLIHTADDESKDIPTRMAALGLIGQRKDERALSSARKCATSTTPSLRRVAIATLGLAGSQGDRPLILAALGDKDPSVSLAASAAIKNVREK